ncbi:hypothetical protein [Streptomyces sp. NPDC048643]
MSVTEATKTQVEGRVLSLPEIADPSRVTLKHARQFSKIFEQQNGPV